MVGAGGLLPELVYAPGDVSTDRQSCSQGLISAPRAAQRQVQHQRSQPHRIDSRDDFDVSLLAPIKQFLTFPGREITLQ